jgi:uncharacterized damage-inducible protein DinB
MIQQSYDLADAMLDTFTINDRMNRLLLESLDDRAWRAEPPGGRGRTIAAIAAHIHNVRLMWLKVSAKGTRIPPQLDRMKVTRAQALAGFAKSHEALERLIAPAVRGDGRVKNFPRGVVAFLGYLMAHDAHHRGQISMLAHQTGYPLPQQVNFGLWEWGKRNA